MVNDREILEYFVDKKRNAIISARINRKNMAKNVPQYKEYLEKRYSDFRGDYCEIVYRIANNIIKIPTCKKCGKQLKYHGFRENSYGTWCSSTCQLSDVDFINKRENSFTKEDRERVVKKVKQTKLERYGNENYTNLEKFKETCLKRYGVETPLKKESIFRQKWEENNLKKYGKRTKTNPDKIAETKLKKYGDAHYCNREKAAQTMIEKYGAKTTMESKELSEKVKQTKLERYGDENFLNQEKAKKTLKEKYGVENPFQLKIVRDKIDYDKVVESKKKNHTFNSSKEEEKFHKLLLEAYIDYTIIKNYKDDRYKNPNNGRKFVCDFYIKELDLFIELNSHYTHGKHPFDINNEKDVMLLNEYKKKTKPSYKTLIEVWTIRDVLKREIAQKNKLNYLMFYGTRLKKTDILNKINTYINNKE